MANLSDLRLGLKQVYLGLSPNDGQGDDLRTAFGKVNANMEILANAVNDKLISARTYYVSPVGDDGLNSGLSATDAFRSIRKAVQTVYSSIDLNGFGAIINVSPGEYAESIEVSGVPRGTTQADTTVLLIQKNPDVAGEVIWSFNAATQDYCLALRNGARIAVNGIHFKRNTASARTNTQFLAATGQSVLGIGTVVFNSIGAVNAANAVPWVNTRQVYLNDSSAVILKAYSCAGGGAYHFYLENRSFLSSTAATGDPKLCVATAASDYNYFFGVYTGSQVTLLDSTVRYSGALNGRTYAVDFFSKVAVNGVLPNTLLTSLNEKLNAECPVEFASPITVNGGLNVFGPAEFDDQAQFSGTSIFTGNTTLSGVVALTGQASAVTRHVDDNTDLVATNRFVHQVVQDKILEQVPVATNTLFGLVKTDVQASDPVVYLKPSIDTLLAAKANIANPTFTGVVTVPIRDLNDSSGAAASTSFVQQVVSQRATFPSGVILMYGGAIASIPAGFLPCDGRLVSRTSYATLFNKIGILWGSTDSTNFRLPDFRRRYPFGTGNNPDEGLGSVGGSESITLTQAQLPSHSHAVNDPGHRHQYEDPGHSHQYNDPGHGHTINDPGHEHRVFAGYAEPDTGPSRLDYGFTTRNPTNFDSGRSTTGITIHPAYLGITIRGAHTGLVISPSGTGLSIFPTGQGNPIPITPSHARVNFIISI